MTTSHAYIPIPIPPQTQGRNSTTFTAPPLDGSIGLPQVFEYAAKHSPGHPAFVYEKSNSDHDHSTAERELVTVCWAEVASAIGRGAAVLRRRFGSEMQDFGSGKTEVVGILSSSDAIPYATTIFSIVRANHAAFPISPRNSPAAVAHLLAKSKTRHMLVSQEPAMRELAKAALEVLQTTYEEYKHGTVPLPVCSDMLQHAELYLVTAAHEEELLLLPDWEYRGPEDVAVYFHSSGSTAFPKAIPFSQRRMIQLGTMPYYGELDFCGKVASVHATPMFHGMGTFQFVWAATCGQTLAVFEPKWPPPVPTLDGLVAAAKTTKSNLLWTVPSFVEAWYQNPEQVNWLISLDAIVYGGGPLNKQIGDSLASQGARLYPAYGSTEGGVFSQVLHAQEDTFPDWDYFRIPDVVETAMVTYDAEAGVYELVIISCPANTITLSNTKVDGRDAYATSDLLIPHPTKAGFWKVFGRADDQIMHSTGEKTNPGPLEHILNQDLKVMSCVIFGRGRFHAGVIVDPKPPFRFDPADEEKLAQFRNEIWPTVEKMNGFAPQHSRVFKEMILVTHPQVPFEYTVKNTPRRHAAVLAYAAHIDAAYAALEESESVVTKRGLLPPEAWDRASIQDFVRRLVWEVLGKELDDEKDVFRFGCDSLQATWIKNSVLRALRTIGTLDTRALGPSFVFEHPTVSSLSSLVHQFVSDGGTYVSGAMSVKSRANAMRKMVAELTKDFPARSASSVSSLAQPNGIVVLLTGTTGALGCHTLARLLEDDRVTRVYALNRTRDGRVKSLAQRQAEALEEKGLDVGMSSNGGKFVLLEGDLASPCFGLAYAVFAESMILVAWRVDFNVALQTYTPEIQDADTVGTGTSSGAERPVDAEVAVSSGYAESKWVSERILLEASARSELKARPPQIVRVGQLCGDRKSGAWNVKEWFPAMVQASKAVGCIPDGEDSISWIPLDLAASGLVDLSLPDALRAQNTDQGIVHLVHPRPAPWRNIVKAVAAELGGIELVTYSVWLERVEEETSKKGSGCTLRAVPLMSFFKQVGEYEAMRLKEDNRAGKKDKQALGLGMGTIECKVAVEHSESLSQVSDALGEEDVKRWLGYWKRVGII
ncbi:acetyl-CoA synthetase-like protein [Coniophora puteana RWD-64-598 SS2]|uniref:Acetyl-CoA synthetase-like protein n=1 Tax=Coniophora puteana (strain RWD-64-598) TaxID=741705 RepID=A0A5M3MJP7_CONPW|nr:acetyl-CoA synthetase-like protein [Coniophora puteana RWD-64-598 SS2]EIW79469.1 acetyl-CoA synthetase-like protein [Coniophora puteana RWD-64-598 SS2]